MDYFGEMQRASARETEAMAKLFGKLVVSAALAVTAAGLGKLTFDYLAMRAGYEQQVESGKVLWVKIDRVEEPETP